MASDRSQAGFTLVEILVALMLFAITSVGFYTVLFQSARGSKKAEDVAAISQESRLGFTRMVRDTREGERLEDAQPFSYTVDVDFDSNGVITPQGAVNSQSDYEVLTYSYDDSDHTIRLNGQPLMRDVYCLKQTNGTCYPVFDYQSDHLEYDWNTNGVTAWQELDQAPAHGVVGVGNNNGQLDTAELPLITNVTYSLRVDEVGNATTFSHQAQLRNER